MHLAAFSQLVILNASAVVGRITPGLIANKVGVANIVVVATFITVGLIFTVIGLHTVAGFVVFSILFGFFSGVCACFSDSLYVKCRSYWTG